MLSNINIIMLITHPHAHERVNRIYYYFMYILLTERNIYIDDKQLNIINIIMLITHVRDTMTTQVHIPCESGLGLPPP